MVKSYEPYIEGGYAEKLTFSLYLPYYKIGKKLPCFGHNSFKNVPILLIFGQKADFNEIFQMAFEFFKTARRRAR